MPGVSALRSDDAWLAACAIAAAAELKFHNLLDEIRAAAVGAGRDVAEVAKRFSAGVVLPFAGAAQTRGPFHLTMDTNDTIETARAFPDAVIVPVHTDGWAHFRQNAQDLRASFDALGFGKRLKILEPGVVTAIEMPGTSVSS